jgi:hypothetical protein
LIFTFWTGTERDLTSATAWRARFPEFRIYSDGDVRPLLDAYFGDHRGLYDRLSLPACKSDIARLLLLREYGGLYVDSHVGPGDGDRLAEVFWRLSNCELVVFDKTWEHRGQYDIHIVNTVIAAQRGSEILLRLARSALSNVAIQEKKERATTDYVPYNIFAMTGAWEISTHLFDRAGIPALKPEYLTRVLVQPLQKTVDPGFQLYRYYEYRRPGEHWSERQKHQRLFET